MRRKNLTLVAIASASALTLAACGGGDEGGGTTGGTQAGPVALEGEGPITLVQGKDTSGFVQGVLEKWNAQHPDQKASLIELPESADAQRQQMIQNAQTKSDQYDVLNLDVVWVAEFAANRWVVELPEEGLPLSEMLEPVLATAKYRDKLYSVPSTSDGGMLYYRTDLLEAAGITEPPKTWKELTDQCAKVQATPQGKGVSCYAGQFEKYEGLTVNAAEAINGGGGVITDEAGKPNVNTPEAKAGLDFLVNGFKQGYIPKEAITYKEEEGRRAFQAGRLLFHRQWPYQYNLANKTDGSSKVAGKFAVAPLPGLNGPGVSSLGGHNLGISAFSTKKKTAMEFIKFFTNQENSKDNLIKASQASAFTALYEDPALVKQFPYLPILKASIESAQPRPKVVRYGDATIAIQDAAYAALRGETTTDQALSQLQTKLEQLTQ
jgi:trehalose/maltose transport system substrate-binding protein